MRNKLHEIRDPIHNFIRLDSQERQVLDSRPLQRLRHIHQLGMSHFIYPGANHTRFEHSLGVMELATRVFNVVTEPDHLTDEVKESLHEIAGEVQRTYWRRALRMAALCHDVGHLPFSHAAEEELLPKGWKHEQLTQVIIESDTMRRFWEGSTPPLRTKDIAKLALGRDEYRPKDRHDEFTTWQDILAEIIVGNVFGADRMDYLLRDSYNLGVPYGRFDHYRLIDTLRIAPPPPSGPDEESQSQEPTLGIEEGGLHCAEALLLARYFMYVQVYFHGVRRICDIHLREFLKEWDGVDNGQFPTDVEGHLALTDNEVMSSMIEAAYDPEHHNHENARRVIGRKHFRLIYHPTPADTKGRLDARDAREEIFNKLVEEFGKENVRDDHCHLKGDVRDFSVLVDGESQSATALSDVISRIPGAKVDYVFIHPDYFNKAKARLEKNKKSILKGGNSHNE